MPDFEVKFNTTQLLDGLSEPFHQANELMGRGTVQNVVTRKYPWPRETTRKRTGEIVGSPRDIVDESTFRQSHKTERLSSTLHEHRFDTEYALAVIKGAVLKNGTTLPARDVFKEPLEKFPKDFEKLARAALSKVQDPP